MAYRHERVAARERIDNLEEELLEAEAELERQAEELAGFELRMAEQVRRQQAEDTQKTRALSLKPVGSVSPRRVRQIAATALILGIALGASLATAVAWLVQPPKPPVVQKSFAHLEPPIPVAPPIGRLTLMCQPSCDQIFVGRFPVGPSPVFNYALRPGIHHLQLESHGKRKALTVDIKAGERLAQRVVF